MHLLGQYSVSVKRTSILNTEKYSVLVIEYSVLLIIEYFVLINTEFRNMEEILSFISDTYEPPIPRISYKNEEFFVSVIGILLMDTWNILFHMTKYPYHL